MEDNSTNNKGTKSDTILFLDPIGWEQNLNGLADPNLISISSYNTLRKNYGFTHKYWVPENLRLWSTRISLHQDLLSSLNTDIICLQEAEIPTFDEDFGFMEQLGYISVKPQAKNTKKIEDSTIHGHTKPSIFYKKNRLNLKWHNPRSRIVLALFQVIDTGRLFYVINCHLQGGAKEEAQRLCQIRSALKELQKHLNAQKISSDQLSLFICGDFNATPEHLLHIILNRGSLTKEEREKYSNDPTIEKALFSHEYKLIDSYSLLSNERRPYTFKWGVAKDAIFNVLDYIYHTTSTLELQALRNPLTDEERIRMLDQLGLPNNSHPSDHLPIAALYLLK